jgi:glyoxylase-like metal-dependent hydrolase (beta-lactamase superfamily II)
MKIDTLVVGPFDVNCMVLHGTGNRVVVVDPGADAPRIAQYLREQNLTVEGWLLTHGHVDHLSVLAPLARDFPAPVAMHPADAAWAFTPRNQIPPYYPVPEAPPSQIRELHDGLAYQAAGLEITIIETPGHTPGCICFYMPVVAVLIAGDTLFAGSAGRTDLPGSNPAQLTDSLRRLARLPDGCTVYPGHGPSTTIGREKRVNPFMQHKTSEV